MGCHFLGYAILNACSVPIRHPICIFSWIPTAALWLDTSTFPFSRWKPKSWKSVLIKPDLKPEITYLGWCADQVQTRAVWCESTGVEIIKQGMWNSWVIGKHAGRICMYRRVPRCKVKWGQILAAIGVLAENLVFTTQATWAQLRFYGFFFFFWPHHATCRILVPWSEIEPGPLAVKVWSPNHWTTRGILISVSSFSIKPVQSTPALEGLPFPWSLGLE